MERVIYSDTRQKIGHHDTKESWFARHGITLLRVALTDKAHEIDRFIAPAGDYCTRFSNITVDTKASIDEIANNINGKGHARFIAEIKRASDAGFRLVFLIENDLGYTNMGDVVRWVNGHCEKCYRKVGNREKATCNPLEAGKCGRHNTNKPIQGARLYKAMDTIQSRYGCKFEFCAPEDAARRICEILGVKYE